MGPVKLAANAHHQYQRSTHHYQERAVADASIERRRDWLRKRPVEHGLDTERERFDDAPQRINHRRDPGVCGPHQWKALLDRPHPSLLEVLMGTGACTEPAVIGEVEKPTRPLAAAADERPVDVAAYVIIKPADSNTARYRIAGKDDLVAHQRHEHRRPGNTLIAAAVARNKPAAHLGELHQADPLEQGLKR